MTDFRWLIEAPGPRYLGVRKLSSRHDFVWTAQHDLAIQFASQEQADLTMMALRDLNRELFGFEATLGPAQPVEHGWMDPSGPPRPSSPPNHVPVA